MKVKPLDRQSMPDIALQTGGGMEAAFELSVRNDIALSAEIDRTNVLETPAAADKTVLRHYQAEQIRPATALSALDSQTAPYGGIGFMGIEIDYMVS